MGKIIVFFVVANEIVSPVGGYHLVRVDKISSGCSIGIELRMELFIRAVIAVAEFNLPVFLDGFVYHFDVEKKLLVFRYICRKIADMLYL